MAMLLVLLIILAVVALFAVQNSAPVTIAFFSWKFEASLAIVIFLSVLTGALVASVVASVKSIKGRQRKKETEKDATAKKEDEPSLHE